MELLPMRTSIERFAGYVARYVTRDGGVTRRNERGARLVRYSRGFKRIVRGRFSWAADKLRIEAVAQRQVYAFKALGIRNETDAEFRWGRGWKRYFNRMLYSRNQTFWAVLAEVVLRQEISDGIPMAIEEVFQERDKIYASSLDALEIDSNDPDARDLILRIVFGENTNGTPVESPQPSTVEVVQTRSIDSPPSSS
jgi:hypothetical protein